MITKEEYQELRKKYDAYHHARYNKFGNKVLTPKMQAQLPDSITNQDVSAIEVYEFINDPPNKYFVYVNEKELKIVTFTGDVLGTCYLGRKYRSNFDDERRSIYVQAINGKDYYGTYYCDTGSYAIIKQYKTKSDKDKIMCDGFGMIITKMLEGFFCEPELYGNCSHSKILSRLGWKDNENQFIRNFIGIQCPDWTTESFEFDEEDTLPGWAEENRDQIINLVNNTLEKVCPVWENIKKMHDISFIEYQETIKPAKNKYETICNNAFKQYNNCTITKTEYKKILIAESKEYNIIYSSANNRYNKICNLLWKLMREEMSNIKGYVSKP